MRGSIDKLAIFSVMFMSSTVQADSLPCGVHTAMQFSVQQGKWRTQVEHINEIGDVVLLKDNCQAINTIETGTNESEMIQQVQAKTVTPDAELLVGHKLGPNENFDTGLLFSMVEVLDSDDSHPSPTKTCLFYVAARAPATPVTRIYELNGARCSFDNDEQNWTYKFSAE